MGLAQLQSAIARLCGDSQLREELRADPSGAASRLELSLAEAQTLAARGGESLDTFARALVAKRFQDASKLLPLTVGALGNRATSA